MNETKENAVAPKPLSAICPAKKPRRPKKQKSTAAVTQSLGEISPSKPITVLKRPVQEKPVQILQSTPTTSAPSPVVLISHRQADSSAFPPTPTATKPKRIPTTSLNYRKDPETAPKSFENRPQLTPQTNRNAVPQRRIPNRLRRKSDLTNGQSKETSVQNRNRTESYNQNGPDKIVESDRKTTPCGDDEREPIKEEELPYLQSECVYPLKKKSYRFTRAVYFCRLCDHHINTLIQAKHHISTSDHKIAKEEKILISLLASIPKPTEAHCEALNEILKLTAEKNGRPIGDLEKCEQVVEILSALIKSRIHPDCYVRMYGSCASGFALKSSNLNLELVYPDTDPRLNHARALMKSFNLIVETRSTFFDVTKDFCHKWPYVQFSINTSQFSLHNIVLSVRNTQAYQVSQFLKTYTDSFPRLRTIGHIWRHWAKICDLDNFQNGGLPAYAFDLMLVHYLQQCEPPLIPVLHELDLTDDEKKEKMYQKDVEKIRNAVSSNMSDWNFAEIFIGLLRYYTVGNDYQAFVVNVRSKVEVSRDTKGWNKKRLAIEDPFMPFKNLAQLTNEMYTYFMRCLQNSYKYFGIPQTFSGPLFFYDNRKLVLAWYNDAVVGVRPANRTNSAVMVAPEVVRTTANSVSDAEKNAAAERSFQVVFNSNARNVPPVSQMSSTDSAVTKPAADSSPDDGVRLSLIEEPVANATNDVAACADERTKRKSHPRKRTVRNYCIKKLNSIDGKNADDGEQLGNEKEDAEEPDLLDDDGVERSNSNSIDGVDEVIRYDRKMILQIAKHCRESSAWPDSNILNSYRAVFNFPKSKNNTFNAIAEDKLGTWHVDQILAVENGDRVDLNVVGEVNQFMITYDADFDLDDDLNEPKFESFKPRRPNGNDVHSSSSSTFNDVCEIVNRPIDDDCEFDHRPTDDDYEIINRLTDVDQHCLLANLPIDDDCNENFGCTIVEDCKSGVEKLTLDNDEIETNIETPPVEQFSVGNHENGSCFDFPNVESESNFNFPGHQVDCLLDNFINNKQLLREIDESFEEKKIRRDTLSSDDSRVDFHESESDLDQHDQSPKDDAATIDAADPSPANPAVRVDSHDEREKMAVVEINVDFELLSTAKLLKTNDYVFKFEFYSFKNDLTKPRTQCDSCRMFNHLSPHCPNPEKELPPLKRLPAMTNTYLDMQTFFVQNVFNYNCISHKRQIFQEQFRSDLESRLRTIWPEAILYLFGSSCNGFGFTHSDLDLCLTFGNNMSLPEGVHPVKIIKKIARMMHQQTDFCDIFPVTRAKVPIVRFFHRESKLEGDISLYNILALRNTNLLYLYSLIDPRVQPLGYMAKVFAKQCDIGDASKGSLSSYAYILMVIHYLQHRSPPVLPILQQIHADPKHPQNFIVDGWETYFYMDLKSLPKIWKGYRKNKETIGELWLGFLVYYTERFDPRNDVVQIRQSSLLTKFEKLWTDRPMAIEDPFDLNHNLASGLSKKMFLYIMKAFRRARDVFGDPMHEQMIYNRFANDLIYQNLGFYFFCVALKTNESPPKDRVCKLCERVGHFVENCPMKRSNKGKWMDEMFNDDDDDTDDYAFDTTLSGAAVNSKEINKTIVFENSSQLNQYVRTQSNPGGTPMANELPRLSTSMPKVSHMYPSQTPMVNQQAPMVNLNQPYAMGPTSRRNIPLASPFAYLQQPAPPRTSLSPGQHTMAPMTVMRSSCVITGHQQHQQPR